MNDEEPNKPMRPRCGARTRAGATCGRSPMANGRCDLHGGKSTGAPKGNKNAWKHGMRSAEMARFRAMAKELRAATRAI